MDIGLWVFFFFNNEHFNLLFQGTWVSFSGEYSWECNSSQVCMCSAFLLIKALFSKVVVPIYIPDSCQHLLGSDFHVFTNLVGMKMYFIMILTCFSLISSASTSFMCIGQPIFHF